MSISRRQTSPQESFIEHTPFMKDEDYLLLMDLYCNCVEFRKVLGETLPIQEPIYGARLHKVNFPLKSIMRMMPRLERVSLASHQLAQIGEDESYPGIGSLCVLPYPHTEVSYVRGLMAFPNLEVFSSFRAFDCILRPTTGKWIPSSIKILFVGLLETTTLDLRDHPHLKKLRVSPTQGTLTVVSPNDFDAITVDFKKRNACVDLCVGSHSSLNILNKRRGNSVRDFLFSAEKIL